MRTIKFRIWSDNKMDYSPETFTGWLNDNFIFDGYDEGKEPVVMQFTGLLDRHGTEIYEGDILDITGTTDDYEIYASVDWNDEEGGWGYFKKDGDDCEIGLLSQIVDKRTIIIGNIYENPELLN